MTQSRDFQRLIDALKVTVATLRGSGLAFALGGGLAAWARGGPVTQNDLDLMVKPEDAEAALAALAEAGMRPERPPEEWLYKAWYEGVLIDLIFCPSGLEISDEVFERADVIAVAAVATPVLALEDTLVTMLCAIDEHSLDYSRLVSIARAVREQIDWTSLRARTEASPYARAFFTLAEGLGISPAGTGPAVRGGPTPVRGGPTRVRVLHGDEPAA
jgi:hypothetical protein